MANTGEPVVFDTYFPPLAKHYSISVYSPYHGSFATIFEDITARKQDEMAVLQTNDALSFLAQYTGTDKENDFFKLLAQYLAKALEADFVCIDSLEECRAAWRAILAHGGPEKTPLAYRAFTAVPVRYADAKSVSARWAEGPARRLEMQREWTIQAREGYREAVQLAAESR